MTPVVFAGCAICAMLAPLAASGPRRWKPPALPRGIVDVHAHVQVADYLAFAAAAGLKRPSFGKARPEPGVVSPAGDDAAAVQLRLQIMDAAGVRMQVLSPTLAPYFADEDSAVLAARLANDGQAKLGRSHPDRFAAFVSLPMPHVEAALAEMRRGLDELGCAGVTLQATCLGSSIAEDRFQPLFEEMNRRRCVLFLHPAVNGLASPLLNDWRLAAAVGPLFEDATVALHLIVKGIPARYPDIRIIVPHLGGGLAGMMTRLDNQLPQMVDDLPEAPSVTARRFWFDTVSHGSAPALRSAFEVFGADRLLPGSDFPVLLSFEKYSETFGYVARSGLRAGDVRRILVENAPALLGI